MRDGTSQGRLLTAWPRLFSQPPGLGLQPPWPRLTAAWPRLTTAWPQLYSRLASAYSRLASAYSRRRSLKQTAYCCQLKRLSVSFYPQIPQIPQRLTPQKLLPPEETGQPPALSAAHSTARKREPQESGVPSVSRCRFCRDSGRQTGCSAQ